MQIYKNSINKKYILIEFFFIQYNMCISGVDTADNRLAVTRQRTRSDGAGLLPPVVRTDGDEQRRSADLPAGQEGRNRVFPAKNRIPPHGPCRNARSDRAVRQPFDRSLFG